MYAVLTAQGKDRSLKAFSDVERARRPRRRAADAAAAEGRRAPRRRRRCGMWATTSRSCTTRWRPTRITRRSTPTARSTPSPPGTAAGGARPEREEHVCDRHPDARAARAGAVALPGAEPAVAALGQRAPVGEPAVQPGRSAQPDARQQGTGVDDVEDPRNANPAWCSDPANKFATGSRCRNSGRQASFYDPKTKQFTLIDTCYCDAPPAVRQRRERDRVLQRAERARSSAGSTPRSDDETQGRAEGGRLVRAGARHQRRRQDHAAVEPDHRPR